MTINIQMFSTPDISIANDVFNFDLSKEEIKLSLSAVSFSADVAARKSLIRVFTFIHRLISKNLPSHYVWLIVGNSAWQPDTRVVRYRKLWGALKFRGHEILGGTEFQESISESCGNLKFFGAQRISELSIETLVDMIIEERCSYILSMPKDSEVLHILNTGWSGRINEDFRVFLKLYKENGLLFKQIGAFDDREWGFICLGLRATIEQLLG